MDADHFDTLTRSLVTPSRRGILSALAAAIGGAVLEDVALAERKHAKQRKRRQDRARASDERVAAEKRKKKKKKKKKKGKTPPPPGCTPNCNSKICGDDGCGGSCGGCGACQECQGGVCVNGANGAVCGPCQRCQSGECSVTAPDYSACPGGNCRAGACVPGPACRPFQHACTTAAECCSGSCNIAPYDDQCYVTSEVGGACHTDADCGNPAFNQYQNRVCVNFKCQEPDNSTCPADADYCTNLTPTCGNGGFCLRPVDGGPSRCGVHDGSTDGSMCSCSNHEDCKVRLYPLDAFCAMVSGPGCLCPEAGQPDAPTFCVSSR